MHITIIYNRDKKFHYGKEDKIVEKEYQDDVQLVFKTLVSLGHKAKLYEVNEKNYPKIPFLKTDLCFNLSYGIGDLPNTEHKVSEILDRENIPYTGADAKGILLTTDKVETKEVLMKNKIPTPKFQIFVNSQQKLNSSLAFPLIVKPVREDASVGITDKSVVTNKKELYQQIATTIKKYNQPGIAEEFINGRELRITVIGNGNTLHILPISELVFGKKFENLKMWKIDDFETKFDKGSPKYKNTFVRCPAKLYPDIENRIKRYAKRAFQVLHGRDYARLDVRLSNNNIPYFLEMNSNPGIGKQDAAATAAIRGGYSYKKFIDKIITLASARV